MRRNLHHMCGDICTGMEFGEHLLSMCNGLYIGANIQVELRWSSLVVRYFGYKGLAPKGAGLHAKVLIVSHNYLQPSH